MEAPGAAAAAWAPASGRTLGKFTLIEPIGEGGMARLFLARTEGLGGFEKRVVVKQIVPHLAEDAEFIARFIQEARLAATLDHPNIAAVYEVDVDDGVYFYSMEYVHGRDLRRVLRRAEERGRPLAMGEIVAVVCGLCAGLHHAHTKRDAQGEPLAIVHRDVSPSNVLIGMQGAVKLTDFGIAKARTGAVSTEAGMLRGKIAYMSPEQCRGEALDRRSDVYAVGALLWEMITGRRLHQAETDIMLLRRIAEVDPPSPRTLRPDCPEALAQIVLRALHRSPSQRYQSAAALLEQLEQLARRTGMAASTSAVARLMEALFGDDLGASTGAGGPRVVGSDGGPATATVAPSDRTPPTGTAAPVGLSPGAVGAGAGPAFEDAPTRIVSSDTPTIAGSFGEPEPEPEQARPRSWIGLSVGLGMGLVLGGGGLYLASQGSVLARPAATEPPAPDVLAAPGSVSEAEPEVATPDERSPAEAEPAPAEVEPAPTEAEPAPTEAEPAPTEAEPAPSSSKPRRKKRARRRGRKPSKRDDPAAINLDSAMPPGLDDR